MCKIWRFNKFWFSAYIGAENFFIGFNSIHRNLKREGFAMNRQILSLDELKVGERANIVSLLYCGGERRRMLDFGMIAGTSIEAVQKSPAGDPVAYFVRGTLIAIRSEDAQKCLVMR